MLKNINRDKNTYRQTSNIRRTSEGNKIVDQSDVVGASPVGAAPTASYHPTGFNILHKDNCTMRRGRSKSSDFLRLILDILRYIQAWQHPFCTILCLR